MAARFPWLYSYAAERHPWRDLRLYAPDVAEDVLAWRCDVGFVPGWEAPFALVLGQVGFLDQFTVTFNRGAAMLAIEEAGVFDQRFGAPPVR